MKRLIFVFMTLVMISSCSVDDDSSNTAFELAKITGNDLPDNFVLGETYTIKVNYILPSQCNSFSGIDARRGGQANSERRDIYVGVVTNLNESTNCDSNILGEQGVSNFSITIDETEDYTFYFWTGLDDSNQPVYSETTVPVQERLTTEE